MKSSPLAGRWQREALTEGVGVVMQRCVRRRAPTTMLRWSPSPRAGRNLRRTIRRRARTLRQWKEPRGRQAPGAVAEGSIANGRRACSAARAGSALSVTGWTTQAGSPAPHRPAADRAAPPAVRLPASAREHGLPRSVPGSWIAGRDWAASSGLVGFRNRQGLQEGPASVEDRPRRRNAGREWKGEPAGRACLPGSSHSPVGKCCSV